MNHVEPSDSAPLILGLLSIHGLFVVIGLLIYVAVSHSLQQRRHPAAAVGWVLAIALIPYVGLPLYLLFGTRKLVLPGVSPISPPRTIAPANDDWLSQLTASMGQPPAVAYINLVIHEDGAQSRDALWSLIDNAQKEIKLSTFILGNDAIGNALMQRLIAKAQAGVRVQLLLDGIGRMLGGWPNLKALIASGVRVELFVPPLHSPLKGRTNLRNHRKMVITDGERLWCGSRNLAIEYFERIPGELPWRDLTFDLRGALVTQAQTLFDRDWAFATDELYKETTRETTEQPSATADAASTAAQIIASGPDQSDDTVHDLLVTACFKARQRILAVTPYFVPSDELLMAMSLAARRGIKVDLILPAHSNHHLADLARHRALRNLAGSGAQVWMVPYMLHAKAVVIDDTLALAGSVNLDARSLFLNYEMMIAFQNTADVSRFAAWMERKRADAVLYKVRAPNLLRDLIEGMVLWLAFQL